MIHNTGRPNDPEPVLLFFFMAFSSNSLMWEESNNNIWELSEMKAKHSDVTQTCMAKQFGRSTQFWGHVYRQYIQFKDNLNNSIRMNTDKNYFSHAMNKCQITCLRTLD